jgi:iron(III) transport system substrate-binding protein
LGNLRTFIPLLLLATIAMVLPLAAGAAPESVTIYSDRHQVEDKLIYTAFTQETGIQVDLVDADFDPLMERLHQEGKASPADLLISVGAATLSRCADAGLFQPILSEELLKAVPADFRDTAGRWLSLAYWARVIIYRKDDVNPLDLSTYEDLAEPKFHGQIVVRSASSPYNIALVASLIAANGTEETETWARGLVANFARPPQGGDSNQLQAVSEGEGNIAVVNTRFWGRFAGSDKVTEREVVSGLGLIYPNQTNRGTQVDVVGVGILKSAPHPKAAQALIQFMLRPDMQERFASANYEYPIRSDVSPAPVLKALGTFKIDTSAISKLGKFTPEAKQVMAKSGWE